MHASASQQARLEETGMVHAAALTAVLATILVVASVLAHAAVWGIWSLVGG